MKQVEKKNFVQSAINNLIKLTHKPYVLNFILINFFMINRTMRPRR